MPKAIAVIPTYNEAANLPDLLKRTMAAVPDGLEILLVDDNSPDGTAQVAQDLSAEYGGRVSVYQRPGKQGLGSAYIAGFSEAISRGPDYVLEMDADLSHAPEDIPRLLERMSDHEVAVGSRWTPGGGAEESWGWPRRLLSRGGSVYSRALLRLKVRDTTTGFKCFRREALERLDLGSIRSEGFAFQVEMAYACQRKGYRVAEVPIVCRHRAAGRSKMSAGIVVEALWRVLAIRFRPRA